VTAGSWRGNITGLSGFDRLQKTPTWSSIRMIRGWRPVKTQRLEAVATSLSATATVQLGRQVPSIQLERPLLAGHRLRGGGTACNDNSLVKHALCREALPILMRSGGDGDTCDIGRSKRLPGGRYGDIHAKRGPVERASCTYTVGTTETNNEACNRPKQQWERSQRARRRLGKEDDSDTRA